MSKEQKSTETSSRNPPSERAWWEIPARGAVFFVILFVMIPGHWYRAAYLYTIGRLFPETVESRIADFGKDVEKRLALKEIPNQLRILVLKAEKQVELWGRMKNGTWVKINYYPIFTLPEKKGPKLSKDELKTPEGIYKIASLDPDNICKLAIKLDYPSQEDKEIAKKEGRSPETMEADFLIHGFGFTKGNISLTNEGMEDMFYLIHKLGKENVRVLISPGDFRKDPETSAEKAWLQKRYEELKQQMSEMQETKEKKDAASGKN